MTYFLRQKRKGYSDKKDLDSNEQSHILPVVVYIASIFLEGQFSCMR